MPQRQSKYIKFARYSLNLSLSASNCFLLTLEICINGSATGGIRVLAHVPFLLSPFLPISASSLLPFSAVLLLKFFLYILVAHIFPSLLRRFSGDRSKTRKNCNYGCVSVDFGVYLCHKNQQVVIRFRANFLQFLVNVAQFNVQPQDCRSYRATLHLHKNFRTMSRLNSRSSCLLKYSP
jgi:hypothetical protein